MPRQEHEQERRLTCIECRAVSDEQARGWRSLLGGLEDDPDDPLEALVFCPDCWEREFGDD